MILGALKVGGKDTILIGLSKGNTDCLLRGMPIHKHLNGMPVDLLIVGGETEQAILDELREKLGLENEKILDAKQEGQ